MSTQNPSIDQYEGHPLYRDILKSILKSQIQSLVDQLSAKIGEETVVLTASLDNGSITDIGTECGLDFIRDNKDIKSQFMGFCINRHFSRLKDEGKPEADSQNKSISKKSQNSTAIKSLLQTSSSPSSPPQQEDCIGKRKKQKSVNEDGPSNEDNSEEDFDAIDESISKDSVGEAMKYMDEKTGETESKNLGNSKRKNLSVTWTDKDRSSYPSNILDLKPSRRKQKPPKRLKTNDTNSVIPSSNDIDSSNDPSVAVPLFNGNAYAPSTAVEDSDLKPEFIGGDIDGMDPLSGSDKYLWQLNPIDNEKIPAIKSGSRDFITPSSSEYNTDLGRDFPAMLNLMRKNSSEISTNGLGKEKCVRMANSDDCGVESDLLTSIDAQLKERALLKYDSSDLPYKVSTPGLSREEVLAMRQAIQNKNIDTNGNSTSSLFDKNNPPPASSKNPVCGLLVSRGPGRLEKMLKCEQCGKVCRTSNMSRHKKRYCLGYPKVRLSFPQ